MNRDEYLQLHRKMCDEMIAITKAKNTDYSDQADPFANFRTIGMYGLDVKGGFLTRMSDKMSRLANFIKRGSFAVKDESFYDTCLDLANYALLLAAYHQSEKQKEPETKGQN